MQNNKTLPIPTFSKQLQWCLEENTQPSKAHIRRGKKYEDKLFNYFLIIKIKANLEKIEGNNYVKAILTKIPSNSNKKNTATENSREHCEHFYVYTFENLHGDN